ncbi:hypothetical protein KIPB_002500 [Kipferlia bialata]|uniref:UBC core domain-containing protein n=1 Tax=Kipferlia bialata TaxID=797122 RepID=A0A9K3CTX6_9EUKA|nr:hypothetical protein KIPB_002500 [Kipferlia bialata]|eukprot:g2500.t1
MIRVWERRVYRGKEISVTSIRELVLYAPLRLYKNGDICLDILQKRWTAAYSIGPILTSIQSLLTEPNPASPANSEAANLFVNDKAAYEQRVKACVKRSWEETLND